MSLTYIAAISSFLVTINVLTTAEAQVLNDGLLALVSLGTLLVTLYGRWRAGGVNMFGLRK